jgi:hypothetical protein
VKGEKSEAVKGIIIFTKSTNATIVGIVDFGGKEEMGEK